MVVMPPAAVTSRVVAARTACDRRHVGALHQAFLVDVGVEELAEERLQLANGIDGGERQRGAPAVDDDVAALAVDGGDQPLGADAPGQFAARRPGRSFRP